MVSRSGNLRVSASYLFSRSRPSFILWKLSSRVTWCQLADVRGYRSLSVTSLTSPISSTRDEAPGETLLSVPKRRPATPVFVMSKSQKRASSRGGPTREGKRVPIPVRPSASIILVSPTNQILLLHRVQTSSSFASAHVFPGGHLSAFHDGTIPDLESQEIHTDGVAYRMAAVRETFEESGILLARSERGGRDGRGEWLLDLAEEVRERGRKEVHGNKVRFGEWVGSVGGVPDLDGLIPFTRWITPTTMRKRFSTQMYLYMLPPSSSAANEFVVPTPTHDGGLEHTAATFDDAGMWLEKARRGEIVLFPPQYYLLTLVSQFLKVRGGQEGTASYQAQRDSLTDFLKKLPTTRPGVESSGKQHPTAEIPWAEKVMSPSSLFVRKADGRVVLAVDKPGLELNGTGRGGDWDRVVLVKFGKGGPTGVEVRWREDVLREERGDSKL